MLEIYITLIVYGIGYFFWEYICKKFDLISKDDIMFLVLWPLSMFLFIGLLMFWGMIWLLRRLLR